ncbi:MAG: hypothetical protein J4215_03810 [Candidatus Diapherotrites archaeon]|uniref:Uncharacterized protein n=1 Tax=Candidatus Iainarchaeum sp. TaxID=3101447 RepID=A0A8T4L4E0_9ARCH|nr:hypothetical protein [Candidatus Diapherotrites archaeon]
MKKPNKLYFEDLPQDIRQSIREIVSHRNRIRHFTDDFLVISGVAGGLLYLSTRSFQNGHPTTGIITGIAASIPAKIVGTALADHEQEHYREALSLQHRLTNSTDPNVQALCQRFPYIIVTNSFDLVGKRFAPRIGFIPIGRRRIPTRKPVPKPRLPFPRTRRRIRKRIQKRFH